MVAAGYSPDLAFISDCLLVVSPEHHKLLCKKYHTREAFVDALFHACNAKLTPKIAKIVHGNRYMYTLVTRIIMCHIHISVYQNKNLLILVKFLPLKPTRIHVNHQSRQQCGAAQG